MRQKKTPEIRSASAISDQRLSGKPTRALFFKAMLLRDPLAVRNSCEYGSKVLTNIGFFENGDTKKNAFLKHATPTETHSRILEHVVD